MFVYMYVYVYVYVMEDYTLGKLHDSVGVCVAQGSFLQCSVSGMCMYLLRAGRETERFCRALLSLLLLFRDRCAV